MDCQMFITSLLKSIKSLMGSKPRNVVVTTRNCKHSHWVNQALAPIQGPGCYLIKLPTDVHLNNARAAVVSRLTSRFPGKRFSTSARTRKNHLEITVY